MGSREPLVCPCGGIAFVENSRASGWWRASINGRGETLDTHLDQLRLGRPKTVKCEDCGRRHPNPARSLND